MIYKKRDLSFEEKAKPYAKYFYMDPVLPAPERVAAMEQPIDPAKALMPENINDLLNPGYFEVEAGWCVLPSGAGYVSNYTKMPGVTVDMFNWWFAWHSLEDLRYKLWWPEGHFGVALGEKDRAKVLDPNFPVTQKIQNVTHYVLEDVGGGPERIAISFMAPEDFGFDMSRFQAPNVGAWVGANGVSQLIDPPPGVPNHKAPAIMCHFVREIPGGIELRTRFWMGMKIINKKPVHLLPEGIKLPPFVPKGLAIHNVFEFTNLAAILPKLYEEQKGVIA